MPKNGLSAATQSFIALSKPVVLSSFIVSMMEPCPGKTRMSSVCMSAGAEIILASAPANCQALSTLIRLPIP